MFANTGIISAFLASIIGTLIPAMIRGSGPLFGGPRPAQTLIFAAMISSLVAQGGADMNRIVLGGIACVSLAGIFQLCFGLLGLGRIIRFAPLPVLAGFTNGVALSMLLSAIHIIFNGQGNDASVLSVADLAVRVGFGVALLFIMLRLYRLLPILHWSLIGLIAGTLLHMLLGQLAAGPNLGEMLPRVTSLAPGSGIAALDFAKSFGFVAKRDLWLIVAPALSLATLNSLESLVIANQQDILYGTSYDSKRVLLGQGIANLLCGLLGGLPSAPSNSRQLVARQMGGTEWSAAIAFALTMAVVLLLTPLFVGAIPKLVVAILLLYMAANIIDPWAKTQLVSWWRNEGDATFRSQLHSNLSVMVAVMGVAVAVNLIAAMVVGVFLSMMMFVRLNSRSIVSRIYFGNKRHSSVMRPLAHIETLKKQGDRIALVELAGPLFFGSGDLLKEEIEVLAKKAQYIILDFRQVGTIDASGAGAIQRIAQRLHRRNVRLSIASLAFDGSYGRMIVESGSRNMLPSNCWFASPDLALEAAEDALLESNGPTENQTGTKMLNLDALQGLDDDQIAFLLHYAEENVYERGAVLFKRNDPGNAMYILLAGQVEIRVPIKGGASQRLIALRPGTLFGEMAILRGAPRSADAIVTAENTEILSLPQTALDKLHREHPDIALTLMRNIGIQLAARLASVTDELRYALASSQDQFSSKEKDIKDGEPDSSALPLGNRSNS